MRALRCSVWILTCALLPLTAAAQQTGASIAGTVTDDTGAVLPGVIAEAASDALIEGVRTAFTDGAGNYSIIELRPGTYTVTFTLPGFSTVVREELNLASGFTANVSVQMQVGGVEETITVTGASPVVDIQNTRAQSVISDEVLSSVPTGVKNAFSYAALTVGMSSNWQDVGGSSHEVGGGLEYHGTNTDDSRFYFDGMDYNTFHGTGGGGKRIFRPSMAAVEEVNLGLSTGSAEAATAGVAQNLVPKEGSNQFTLQSIVTHSSDALESDNLSDDLRARGIEDAGGVITSWDNSLAVGGPIRSDRAWFFTAVRFWGNHNRNPDAYFNKTQGTRFYTPDLSKPADANLYSRDSTSRLTWQVNDRNKVSFGYSRQVDCFCTYVASKTLAPEFFVSYDFDHHLTQGTWTYPATNELLFTAGISYGSFGLSTLAQDNVGPDDISIIDVGTGQLYGSVGIINIPNGLPYSKGTRNDPLSGRFSVSYVTGSHNLKVGLQTLEGFADFYGTINQDIQYLLFNNFPILINQFSTPMSTVNQVRSLALFVQDQWAIDRMTLNLGVRFDYFKGTVKANEIPAGRFVAARSIPQVDNVPNFKDVTPRLGVAYDLFGDGKTAIKAAWGMYLGSEGAGLTQLNDPALLVVTSTLRTWYDADGDFDPDCDLTNFGSNGECGGVFNNLFGQSVAGTSYADDVIGGSGNRTQNWQSSISLTQELRPGWSATFAWHRNHYKNFLANVNTAVAAGDFDTFCVPAPMDSRLPNGGGYDICGVADVDPSKFGQVLTEIQQADGLGVGALTRVYNGFELTVNARFGQGGILYAGLLFGRSATNDCSLNDTPNAFLTGAAWNNNGDTATGGGTHPLSKDYCDIAPPWSKTGEVKINGVYPLPYGISFSAVFQNLPGIALEAFRTYTNAEVAPFLGRNLSTGSTGTIEIPVVAPETLFENRLTQVDLRFSKTFELGQWQVKGNLDLYNALNESAVTQINDTFGANWLAPQRVMFGRLIKLSAQVDF